MSQKRYIDLSISIEADLPSDPPVMIPKIDYVDHIRGAEQMKDFFPGIGKEHLPGGLGWALEFLTLTTHSGTHLDAPYHYHPTMDRGKPALTIDEIPLEWCFNDGVLLDFRHKKDGERITAEDLERELERIEYDIKPLDIVLVMTGVSDKYYGQKDYTSMHPGSTRESTLWLVDQGIKVMGIDAWGWDKPFEVMVKEVREGKKEKLWAAHFAGREKEYCHIENLTNLSKIPKPFGFKVAVFPIKIENAGGGWINRGDWTIE